MTGRSVTQSPSRRLTPYELWYGQKISFTIILPFGTAGYLRRYNNLHKLAPWERKSILLGPAIDRPLLTYRVRDLITGSVVLRQPVVWHQ